MCRRLIANRCVDLNLPDTFYVNTLTDITDTVTSFAMRFHATLFLALLTLLTWSPSAFAEDVVDHAAGSRTTS